jgi:hypothetical protein
MKRDYTITFSAEIKKCEDCPLHKKVSGMGEVEIVCSILDESIYMRSHQLAIISPHCPLTILDKER